MMFVKCVSGMCDVCEVCEVCVVFLIYEMCLMLYFWCVDVWCV